MNTASVHLVTKAEYDLLTPREQGFVNYMQADLPGSELKGLDNPYRRGSEENEAWAKGNIAAMLMVQDSEE